MFDSVGLDINGDLRSFVPVSTCFDDRFLGLVHRRFFCLLARDHHTEADYGVIGSVVECKSDASMYQVALVEAGEQSDVVVAVGWQFWDGLTAVVPEMPDTKFIFVDNGLDGVGDNLLSITYARKLPSFSA